MRDIATHYNARNLLALMRKGPVRSMAATMVSLSTSRLLALVMAAVIARHMGPNSFGAFAFATGIALIAAQLGGLGWPTLLTRMIPKYAVLNDFGRMHGLLRCADIVMLVAMSLLAIAFVLFSVLLLDAANPLQAAFFVAAVLIVPTGFRFQQRQQAAALGKPAQGIFLDEVVPPLFVLAGFLVYALNSDWKIYAAFAAGTFASAILTRVLCQRWTNPQVFKARPVHEFGSWMAVAVSMMTATATRVLLSRVDVILLAPLSTVYQVGLYNSGFRIAFIATMFPMMVSSVVRPMLAAEHEKGEHRHVARIMRHYFFFTAVASTAISLFIIIFANDILTFTFGPQFAAASQVLRILAVSMLFGAIADASSSYLLMCGKERFFGWLSLASLGLIVALNFWLIPLYGAKGAAYSSAIVNLLFSTVAVWAVWEELAAKGEPAP